jgi:hypothetical protein
LRGPPYSTNFFVGTILAGMTHTLTFNALDTIVIKSITVVSETTGAFDQAFQVTDLATGVNMIYQSSLSGPFSIQVEPNIVLPVGAALVLGNTGADMDWFVSGFSLSP